MFGASRREPDIVVDGRPIAAHTSIDRGSPVEINEVLMRVREAMAEGHTLIVLSGATCLDSGELGALINEADRGARFVFCGMTGKMKVVFDMLGLGDFITSLFVESIDDFIDKWRSGAL